VLRIATWNIGGGILGASHQRDGQPSLDYYAAVLKEHAPDIVCLQEAYMYRGPREGQAEYLGEHSGYPHVISVPLSESHIADDAYLSLGILSRYPISTSNYKQFPNPRLTAVGPAGDYWKLFDKGYIEATIERDDGTVGLVNAHCFPLHYFGASPTEARFAAMWAAFAQDLMALRRANPAVAALDLNYEPIRHVLAQVLRPDGYVTAFEHTPTTPEGMQQDYILVDHRVRLLETTITPTKSDHSYCQVSLAI
jgi:endonuclease/exonuclease/phosphatase family metal-dependent hydrolase